MRTDDGNKRKMELLSARMFRLCLCDSGLNLSPSAMQIRTVRCRALAYFAFHELNKGGPVGPPFLLSGMKSFLTSPRLVSASKLSMFCAFVEKRLISRIVRMNNFFIASRVL